MTPHGSPPSLSSFRHGRRAVTSVCLALVAVAASAQGSNRFPRAATSDEAFSAQAADFQKPLVVPDGLLANEWTGPVAQLGWATAAQAPRARVVPPFAHIVPVSGQAGAVGVLTDGAPARRLVPSRTFMLAGYAGPPNLLASAGDIDQLFVEGALQPIARGAAALSALAHHRSLDHEVRRADMGTQVLAIIGLIGLLAWRKLGTAAGYPR